jgi:DNA-binding transcriptional ArsR family regulator
MATMRPTPADAEAILSEDVPVEMPELPPRFMVTTLEQFRAITDPTRSRILGIIQNQPATAKQIANRLGKPPGTIGYHLQNLEEAGLAQVVARRLVRGIVAKYYTRTARIFTFDLPRDITGDLSPSLDIMTVARNELAEALEAEGKDAVDCVGFPHARLSPERVRAYQERLDAVIEDLIREPADPSGHIYGLCTALFKSPPYLQVSDAPQAAEDNRGAASSTGLP